MTYSAFRHRDSSVFYQALQDVFPHLDVVIAYRNTGRGWQGRINAVLKRTVRTNPTPHLAGTVVEAPAARGRHLIAKKAAKKR